MNLYLRYFDKETLVYNVEEALDFLRSIPEIGMTPNLEADVRDYANSEVYYPKRYKIRPRVYFIIIKTTAATMLDFKQKKALHSAPQNSPAAENTKWWQLSQQSSTRNVLVGTKANSTSSVLFLCLQLASTSTATLTSL